MYSALPERDCEGQPSAVHAALPLRLRKRSIGCSEVYGNDKVSITHNPEVVRVRTTLGFKLDGGGPCRATSGPRTFVNESVAYCWCDLIPLRRRSIASSYSLRRRVFVLLLSLRLRASFSSHNMFSHRRHNSQTGQQAFLVRRFGALSTLSKSSTTLRLVGARHSYESKASV